MKEENKGLSSNKKVYKDRKFSRESKGNLIRRKCDVRVNIWGTGQNRSEP